MIKRTHVVAVPVKGAQQAAPLRRGRRGGVVRRPHACAGATVAALAMALSMAAVPVRAQSASPKPAGTADPGQTAAQSARAKGLGKRVKCMCGGCNDAAGSCYHSGGTFSGPCETALGMLSKVDARVASGESDDAVLKSFVQEYGPTVLIEPPKSGFNLAAWIMPILVPLVALFAVWEAVRKWRQRATQAPVAGAGDGNAKAVPSEFLERVQRETGRD